ncbi:MAG: UpxY family transcription antiterminator [Bryobacteraceae bacterium]|nr:UpxY family transcription antiterminator [Bryobacteraceae bacterium]
MPKLSDSLEFSSAAAGLELRHDTAALPWYALRVRSRHERVVEEMLRRKGWEAFVPVYKDRRRWADRIKVVEFPLFPGYVFCRLEVNNRLPVVNTPGVVEILGNGRELLPVENAEIRSLQTLMASGLNCEPWERLMTGDEVQIDAGPLKGLHGSVVDIRKGLRLVLAVTLLHRSVLVAIEPEWVTPLNVGARALLVPRTSSNAAIAG